MIRHGRVVPFLWTLLSFFHLPHKAAGDASDSLLGGQYQPTTNIDHIIQLTELIEAIELNANGLATAEFFYQTESHGLSLEKISNNADQDDFSYDSPGHFLDQSVNPLYAIYMFGLWRGVHGNGNGGNTVPRESMKFLSQPVDFYGHTIIQAEFEKQSGYDAEVTAQTIRVTNLWMATVQALYNGVQMCVERPEDYEEPNFVNPIDMAAAFWIGTQDDESDLGGGSLYAWAKDIGSKFTGMDVNAKIVDGLNSLQMSIQNCFSEPEDEGKLVADMRAVADNITRLMTVPLVQSLLWHSTNLGDANNRDFVVLYGLMTLPPIIVCDDKAFTDLYDEYVVKVRDANTPDSFTSARKKLESRYACLGIDCDMVGEAVFTLPGGACVDAEMDIHGYGVASQELREVATVDLDVRTIGTLVEMNANQAADDIYHYGRFSRIGLQGGYYPLQKYATGQSHPSNTVATAFSNHFSQLTHPSDNIVDDTIMGKGAFAVENPRLRRIIAEASMVTILLHIYALDSMYEAIDDCDVAAWDRATASLTGWAEGTENARGLLFFSIGRFLCSRTASCEVANSDHGEDSKVNKLIMLSLKIGRDTIEAGVCSEAKDEISKIETLILTEIVDATAYFAQQVAQNPSNDDNKADLYGLAWALIPLIKDTDAEQTIRTNVGLSVNTLSQAMVEQVLSALKTVVSEANISCTLLDTAICDAESLIPQTGISDTDSAVNVGETSQSLLSYTPSTNVQSIIQLTVDIENIQKESDKDASYKIYDKDDAVSLKHISTNQSLRTYIRNTNPLYSLYMYALWKSADGGTADGGDKEFDNKPVEFFANSIVEDEYNKPSGYNPQLTGETMRVAIMWMATVQSIYEAVEFCSSLTAEKYPDLVNPIDKAAAFWIGNQQDTESVDGGSLYAWTKRMHKLFETPSFDANVQILKNLSTLKLDLDFCLEETKLDDEKEKILQGMWSVAKSTITAMTVPLMQNLLYSVAVAAGKATLPGPDQTTIADSMILFALITLPQLMVCDEAGFKHLYQRTISESLQFDSSFLSDTVTTIQKNYACLEISCAQVGKAPFMFGDWPACQDLTEFSIVGYEGVSSQTMDVAKVDIDIRTIGMLIEIGALDAAANVYKYGGVFKDAYRGFSSIQSLSSSPAQSAKGNELKGLYSDFDPVAHEIVLEAFDEESSIFQDISAYERKVMAEASMVSITLHIYAIDSLFWADELCDSNGSDAVKAWDTAAAALVGWTEGSKDGGSSDNGVLFYNIAQYLCKAAGTCNMANDSELNRSLIGLLEEGKQQLLSKDCVGAYTQAMEVEKLLQTVLVDTVAFFARQIVDDKLDTESAVEGYIFAEALMPIFNTVDPVASSVISQNLGAFPNDNLMKDGVTAVFVALRSFVNREAIDCALLTTPICQYNANTNTNTPPVADNDGFLPDTDPEDDASPTDDQNNESGLLGGAYMPSSNVNTIIKLTDKIAMIANAETADVARAYYTQSEDGISLKSLSTDIKWEEISKINPLYVLYMYGFWNSESGDSDGDGYSNKLFDNEPLLPFGDTIITDEIEKKSGFDAKLTAETISLVNVWMAITSELYKAVAFCRDGTTTSHRNPIDDAAAFWFGSHTDPNETTGSSLFAWASRAQSEFTGFDSGVNDEMIDRLTSLQDIYASCEFTTGDERKDRALGMKTDVEHTINIMTVPLVQNFIQSLASMSGLTTEALNDRGDYLVLYSLMVLPLISICDEIIFDDIWEQVFSREQSYTATTFSEILKMVQDRLECLGITCSMVGRSLEYGDTWPECVDNAPSNRLELAGYSPATDDSLSWSKIDLDISTILSFIVMEATPLAADIYNDGRNVDDTITGKYFSINGIRTPSTTDVQDLWDIYLTEGDGCWYSPTNIVRNAIEGTTEFESTSPLKNSAAASLALATIDMHIATLDIMYQAKAACILKEQEQASSYWDRAAAVTIGWAEGASEGGSDTDGHLFFQIAQELCDHFDSCDENNHSKINNLIVEEFRTGLQYVRSFQCERVQFSIDTIATLFQAILVDNLAFHTQFASGSDDTHCLLAYVSANAIAPFLRGVNPDLANTVEAKIRVDTSTPLTCVVEDTDAIYSSLKTFVATTSIDCDLLGSQVCGLDVGQNPIDSSQDSVYTSNDSGHTVANGEYVPDVDVKDISNLKTRVQGICNADDAISAREYYEEGGDVLVSIESMSLYAKFSMDDELLFNQYVYALYDDVDKTDGSFMFNGHPATEYAHSIVNDAFDAGIINTSCLAIKVLHIWMYIVHKLQLAVQQCDEGIPENYGAIDEAAALWESGLLFEMADELGPKFGHEQMDGMTYLNRQIIDRFNSAQVYHQDKTNSCQSKNALGGLRIIVKEIVSYMTAVLIQQLIFAMVDYPDSSKTQEDMVELMSFVVLPRIMGCGHEMVYDDLYEKLATRNFDKGSIPFVTDAIHSHLNCLGLSCDDIGTASGIVQYPACSDNFDIVGYAPVNPKSTNVVARLDLDAVAINQMIQLEKYDIATNIYLEGHNYYDYDKEDIGFVSLRDMTQSATIGYNSFPQYELYSSYFREKGIGNDPSPGKFAHQIFMDATSPDGRFATATTEERRSVVEITLASFVSYFSALEALYYASFVCPTNKDSATAAYDGGVAFLVGSVEGTERGGNSEQEGRFFYNVAKLACIYFDTCVEGNDAEINHMMLEKLTVGQVALKSSNCDGVSEAIDSFAALTVVPLMQSLLSFADVIDNEPDGYAASMAIAPVIYDVDDHFADKIVSDMAYDITSPDKKIEVYNAIETILSDEDFEDIACNVISSLCDEGESGGFDIPAEDPTPIRPEELTPISGGLYVATSYTGDKSAIALDVKEIEERLQVKDVDRATFIYEEGMNSKIYDDNGMPTSEERSIQDFSLKSGRVMLRDPTYNLFVTGLSDEYKEFLGRPVEDYADSYVSNLLYSASPIAGDAMVAINIWMEVTHSLHSAYEACKSSVLSEDRSIVGRKLVEPRVAARFIDEAAAYWIGDGQATGSSSRGHLLYALTEIISEEYGEDSSSQSTINTRIIDLLQQAKNHIAISRSCTTSTDSHLKLRSIIDEIVPLMAVPLLRALLHAMKQDDAEKVKLYAIAVLPLFAKCNPSTYSELKNDLIDNTLLSTEKNYVYSRIISLYDCLGLECDLIGKSIGEDFAYECEDGSNMKSLAGYRYAAEEDVVSSAAKIDIEIRLLEIYMNNGMEHFPDDVESLFGLAYEQYRFGNGSLHGEGSLSRLAKDVRRDIVPSFPQFRRYFKSDENYADKLIVDAFEEGGIFNKATADYRKRVILFTSKYMVTHMAILQKLYSAVKYCQDGDVVEGVTNLDIAAAYYTGSFEGTEDGGTFDGSLNFFLARRMCIYFDTCSQSNNALINERMISLFYSAQGELDTKACVPLERTVKQIDNALLVPLIQGTLFACWQNSYYFNNKILIPSTKEFLPEGYVLAQSILPIIANVDIDAANEIKSVMVDDFLSPTRTGSNHAVVFAAFKRALAKMDGVDCKQIGSIGGQGFCPGDADPTSSSTRLALSSIAILMAVVGLPLIMF